MHTLCPACENSHLLPFFELYQVPVHQNALYDTESKARSATRGDIVLGFCPNCGFISNSAFQGGLLNYSPDYDNTQCYSPFFNDYMLNLARILVERHQLHEKLIIEIGCGKGDFIKLLCRLGPNNGIGFDPSYIGEIQSDRVRFIQDFYTEQYAHYEADFYCSRHVIEHIEHPAELIRSLRRTIGDQPGKSLFMETPDVTWILRNTAFWDIFYEHCSLFSPGSLARLYAQYGWDTTHVTSTFGGQYMWVEGAPAAGHIHIPVDQVDELKTYIQDFRTRYHQKIEQFRQMMQQHQNQRMVIWGAGAKGVTFLNALSIAPDTIATVVDVNPRKQGMFIAGTGQQIVSPDALQSINPEVVWVMNPIYAEEIWASLQSMQLSPEFILI